MKKVILKKPLITEKSLKLKEKENIYTFIVNIKSNKLEIKKEIEKFFKVKVLNIRTNIFMGKKVKFGKKRIPGKKSNYKKAFVKLEKSNKIDLFNI